MTIWKKALSVGTSAALLASLLATVMAPAAFGASGTLSCTVTGGGTSQSAAFGASAAMAGNWQPGTTFACTNNATPAGVAGGWAASGGQVATVPAPTATAATIVLGSSANPSSASVSFTAGDATVATITFSVLPLAVALAGPNDALFGPNEVLPNSATATATNAIGNGLGAGAQANAKYSGSSGTPAAAGTGCTATAGTAALAAAVSTATATISRTVQGSCQAQFAYTVENKDATVVAFATFTVSFLSRVVSFWDDVVTASPPGVPPYVFTDNTTTSGGSVVTGSTISGSASPAAGAWTATGATPASSTASGQTFTVTAPVGGTVTIQWQSVNGFYHRFTYAVVAPPLPAGSGASAVTTSGFGNVTRGGSSAAGTFTLTEGALTNFSDGTVTVTPTSSAGVSGTGSTAVWFDPASTPTATVTSGIGSVSASVSAGGVLTITISGATGSRLDNFTVSGLKVKAGATAALGAVQFRYATTGTNLGLINATASGTLTTNTGTGVQSPTYTLAAGSPDFQVTATGATPPISNATFVGGVTESVALTAAGGGSVTANFSTNHPSGTTFSQTVQAQWFPQGATVVDTTVLKALSVGVVLPGVNSQTTPGNLTVTLGDAGFVPAASTLTFAITTPGVQFSVLPTVASSGNFAVGTGVLSLDRTSITYTVTTASTTDLQVLTLSNIKYDVALSATAGAMVNVTLTISGGVAVSGSPAANAQIAETIIGSGAVPTIIIGNNDQPTGLLTIRESAAGTLPDDTTVSTDKIVVCTTTGETFSRAPWFVVTAGDLKFNVGGVAATQAKATLSTSTCAFVQVYSASTVASTIEVRAGVDAANTAPKPSGPNNGATVNVGSGLLPGPTLVQVSISATGAPGGTPQGAPVVVAMRALAGSPIVAAASQPFVTAGGMNQVAGDVTISEGSTANFAAGETISLCLVTQALTISTDTFFANTAGVGMPIVTTNNATSGLVASITYSSTLCSSTVGGFQVKVENGAIGALGVITVSGLKYNVNVGSANGPVFLQVMKLALPAVGTDFNQVVSNATIGAPAAVAISAATALGATKVGPFSTTTKVAALGKYVTWRFAGGSALAGKTVQIWVATKNADGSWGAFTLLTGRVADASGNAYFWWRSSSAKWISVRAYYAGDATHSASWSAARQGRWM